jgi:hypothetical protein
MYIAVLVAVTEAVAEASSCRQVLVPRGIAARLTFAHVNVSTITHKIMYQTDEKLQEMCLKFRYFLPLEVLQKQVQVVLRSL